MFPSKHDKTPNLLLVFLSRIKTAQIRRIESVMAIYQHIFHFVAPSARFLLVPTPNREFVFINGYKFSRFRLCYSLFITKSLQDLVCSQIRKTTRTFGSVILSLFALTLGNHALRVPVPERQWRVEGKNG